MFNVGRIPALGMEKITGLAAALAGKAAEAHTHAMSQISGLVDELANKAAAVHNHTADAIVSGVFAVGRIPALGMEKITGLAVALASKAELAGAIFTGNVSIERSGANVTFTLSADSGRVRQITWATSGVMRWIMMADETPENGDNSGSDLLLMNRSDAGAYLGVVLRLVRATGQAIFSQRPMFGAATPWDNLNFDPRNFAGGQINGGSAGVTVAGSGGLNVSGNGGIRSAGPVVVQNGGNVSGGDHSASVLLTISSFAPTFVFDDRSTGVPQAAMHYNSNLLSWRYDEGANGQLSAEVMALNMVQRSLRVGGHEVLSMGNLDLWWPAGEQKFYDAATVPAGVRAVVANGAAVSRTTYARLFAAIGTRYGAGNGSTTFNLPDWRGLFFRGLDNGRGYDAGRALGAEQDSQNKLHNHTVVEGSANNNTSHNFIGYASGDDFTSLAAGFSQSGFEGGSEARPRNAALLACITY